MIAWLFRIGLSVTARLIPFLVGRINWKLFTKGEKAFIVLLGYDALGIMIGAFLAYYVRNNIIMTNIYCIVEVFLLSFFFNEYVENAFTKKFLRWFPYLYAIIFITTILFTGIQNNNPSGTVIRILFILAFGSIAMGQIAGQDENLVHQGRFWIVLGLLIHYLINFGFLSLRYYVIENKSIYSSGLRSVLNYSFYAANLLYTFGFWLIAKERKQQLQ